MCRGLGGRNIFASLKEAAENYNISPSSVTSVITSRRNITCGLKFKKYGK